MSYELNVKIIERRFLDGFDDKRNPIHSASDYRADVGYLLSVIQQMKKGNITMVKKLEQDGSVSDVARIDIKEGDIFKQPTSAYIVRPWMKATCDTFRDEAGVHMESVEATDEEITAAGG